LSNKELQFLQEGAYISILKGGTIRFNRIKWKLKDIKNAKKYANELLRMFKMEDRTWNGTL